MHRGAEASEFLEMCEEELELGNGYAEKRLNEIRNELDSGNCWPMNFPELEHGARVAWRNNARCIGRLFWSSLLVRDRRELTDPAKIADDLQEHVR